MKNKNNLEEDIFTIELDLLNHDWKWIPREIEKTMIFRTRIEAQDECSRRNKKEKR